MVWVMVLRGYGPMTLPANTMLWHGHEMLVGFAMATIAGFILTAVATWTGRPPVNGPRLALLVLAETHRSRVCRGQSPESIR